MRDVHTRTAEHARAVCRHTWSIVDHGWEQCVECGLQVTTRQAALIDAADAPTVRMTVVEVA